MIAIIASCVVICSVPAHATTITFDSLASGTVVTNQFADVTFSSTAGFENVTLTFSGGTSSPMVICTRVTGGSLNCDQETTLVFASPVSGLSFLGTGIDDGAVTVAQVEVFENFVSSGSVGITGSSGPFTAANVDLSAFSNVTSIRIHSITDTGGIAWDDFSFTLVPEPSTALLLSLGLVGLACRRRAMIRRALDRTAAAPPHGAMPERG